MFAGYRKFVFVWFFYTHYLDCCQNIELFAITRWTLTSFWKGSWIYLWYRKNEKEHNQVLSSRNFQQTETYLPVVETIMKVEVVADEISSASKCYIHSTTSIIWYVGTCMTEFYLFNLQWTKIRVYDYTLILVPYRDKKKTAYHAHIVWIPQPHGNRP